MKVHRRSARNFAQLSVFSQVRLFDLRAAVDGPMNRWIAGRIQIRPRPVAREDRRGGAF